MQKNIYDMAGNINEWTLEKTSAYGPCAIRGANFMCSGSIAVVANRSSDTEGTQYSRPLVGFRVAIY